MGREFNLDQTGQKRRTRRKDSLTPFAPQG